MTTGIKRVAQGLVSVLMLVFAAVAAAQEAVPVPAGGFERVGVVDHLDFASRVVIIGGQAYPLARSVEWHGLEAGSTPASQYEKFYRQRVGYRLNWSGGAPEVAGIWVLSRSR